ncbi:hypothetical protein SO802_004488 [Lithocarpus litseifolius]|uniref:Uncharacterized protein n=1 Tax=Lithocarpus litseifolius TaxID=425828 RepID=A0AAW2E4V4_9ROSI
MARSNWRSERRQQTEETPQMVVANPVDPNLSTEFQNKAIPEIQAPNSPTSLAGNVVNDPESFTSVMPEITQPKSVTFDDQLQDIDMELNKFDSHATFTANLDFQDVVPSRESRDVDVICVHDSPTPLDHVDAHVPNSNSRDHEGNQPCLRTWKRLARLNQNIEPAMHAPTLGKRTSEAKGIEETEQASKRDYFTAPIVENSVGLNH